MQPRNYIDDLDNNAPPINPGVKHVSTGSVNTKSNKSKDSEGTNDMTTKKKKTPMFVVDAAFTEARRDAVLRHLCVDEHGKYVYPAASPTNKLAQKLLRASVSSDSNIRIKQKKKTSSAGAGVSVGVGVGLNPHELNFTNPVNIEAVISWINHGSGTGFANHHLAFDLTLYLYAHGIPVTVTVAPSECETFGGVPLRYTDRMSEAKVVLTYGPMTGTAKASVMTVTPIRKTFSPEYRYEIEVVHCAEARPRKTLTKISEVCPKNVLFKRCIRAMFPATKFKALSALLANSSEAFNVYGFRSLDAERSLRYDSLRELLAFYGTPGLGEYALDVLAKQWNTRVSNEAKALTQFIGWTQQRMLLPIENGPANSILKPKGAYKPKFTTTTDATTL